jgi:AraC-like DNA-binding protein
LFAGIADELEGRRAYYREIIQSKATEVGWQLLRACGGLAVDLPKAGNGAGALKVLLDREWRSRKDLGEIGGQLLMSREYLRHLFKKEYGVSPVQYLIMKRMDHARSLLRSTDQSVKSIAYECGFGDEHYFSRLFRKAVGVSPSEFRRRRLG